MSRASWIALIALCLFGAAIRTWPAVEWPLWFDEVCTYRDANRGFTPMLRWDHSHVHSPLSYIGTRLITKVLGDEEPITLRLFALIVGSLCIPFAFLLGRTAAGVGCGLLTALLVTMSPTVVEQSHQARMYSLLGLVIIVTMIALIRVIKDQPREPWPWFGLGLLLAGSFWTHPLGLTTWGAMAGSVIWLALPFGRSQEGGKPFPWVSFGSASLAIAMAISYLGIWKLFGNLRRHNAEGEAGARVESATQDIAELLMHFPGIPFSGLVFITVAIYGVWIASRTGKRAAALVISMTAAANLVLAILSRSHHHVTDMRYLVGFEASCYLGIAVAATVSPNVIVRRSCLALALVSAACFGFTSLQKQQPASAYQLGAAVELVQSNAEAGDTVQFYPGFLDLMLLFYPMPEGVELIDDGAETTEAAVIETDSMESRWLITGHLYEDRRKDLHTTLQQICKRYNTVYPRQEVEERLERGQECLLFKISRGQFEIVYPAEPPATQNE